MFIPNLKLENTASDSVKPALLRVQNTPVPSAGTNVLPNQNKETSEEHVNRILDESEWHTEYQCPKFTIERRGSNYRIGMPDDRPTVIVLPYCQQTQRVLGGLLPRVTMSGASWELPRSLANPGETPVESAVRILKVQTGIEAKQEQCYEYAPIRSDTENRADKIQVILVSLPYEVPADHNGKDFAMTRYFPMVELASATQCALTMAAIMRVMSTKNK